jgi:hypothetical protein
MKESEHSALGRSARSLSKRSTQDYKRLIKVYESVRADSVLSTETRIRVAESFVTLSKQSSDLNMRHKGLEIYKEIITESLKKEDFSTAIDCLNRDVFEKREDFVSYQCMILSRVPYASKELRQDEKISLLDVANQIYYSDPSWDTYMPAQEWGLIYDRIAPPKVRYSYYSPYFSDSRLADINRWALAGYLRAMIDERNSYSGYAAYTDKVNELNSRIDEFKRKWGL